MRLARCHRLRRLPGGAHPPAGGRFVHLEELRTPRMERRQVMDGDEVRRAVVRVAHEILEKNRGPRDLALVGILKRGAPLADRIGAAIARIEGVEVDVGRLDITLYRDDYPQRRPAAGVSSIPFDINGKRIILVDDVLFTGRTVRAAITALMDLGRPASIQLAVLADRGHRELPIRPDYVGKNLPTALSEHVDVHLAEIDGEDAVYIRRHE